MTERREGVTRDLQEGDPALRWVANSSALIWGDRDAVLVDTFTTIEQNDRLIDWIRAHGRTLTRWCTSLMVTVTTRSASDSCVRRSRGARRCHGWDDRPVAPAGRPVLSGGLLESLFPGQILPVEIPEALDTDRFDLEGNELRVIDTGHTDTDEHGSVGAEPSG